MNEKKVMAAVRAAVNEVQANFGDMAGCYLLPAVETYLVEAGIESDMDSIDLDVEIGKGVYPVGTVAVIEGRVVSVDVETGKITIE